VYMHGKFGSAYLEDLQTFPEPCICTQKHGIVIARAILGSHRRSPPEHADRLTHTTQKI